MKKYYVSMLIVLALIAVGSFAWYKNQENKAHLQESASAISVLATSTVATSSAPHSPPIVSPPPVTHPIVTPATKPALRSLSPASAPVGTTVTIHGSGFSKTSNEILFGTSTNRHHVNGTPDNEIANAVSTDGTTLTFTVPTSGPSGIICDTDNHCIAISAIRMLPGTYPVTVRTSAGTSNSLTFTVTAN